MHPLEVFMSSAAASNDYPLNITGNNLQIGPMLVPIRSASYCYILNSVNVLLDCATKKGPNYKATVTLQLKTVEKVRECMGLLIAKTEMKITFPMIMAIMPKADSVSFTFASREGAQSFGTCCAPFFFPEAEYELKLDGIRCQVLGKTEDRHIDRIAQILYNLDNRASGHVIQQRLNELNDPRFPIQSYPKEPPRWSGL